MSKDKEHMDKTIQDKLLQAEVTPPVNSWNAIEASLDGASNAKPMLYYVRYVAAAALVGLLITIGVFQLGGPEKQPDVITIVDQDTIDIKEVVQDSMIQQPGIEETVIKPKESGIRERRNIAIIAEPKIKESVIEQKSPLIMESILKSLDGIYHTSAIALNTIIFDLPKHKSTKSAKQLYKEYLAANYKLFNDDEKLTDRTDKFRSVALGYGSALAASIGQRSGEMASDPAMDTGSGYNEALFSISNSNKPEERLNNFSFGLNVNYQITKRLTLQSGIGYYKQGQAIKDLNVFSISGDSYSAFNDGLWSSKIAANTQNGNIVVKESTFLLDNSINLGQSDISGISGILYTFDLSQYFEYLEIPLIAGYTLLDRRFKLTLLAGLNTGILIGNNVYITDAESISIGSTEDMNTFIYKGIMGFSIDLPVFKQFHLFISPSFRYQLNKTNKNVDAIPNRSYLDFKTGLSYWF